ncbi:hypothetical protein TVAG_151580 [Trichomonas vaginalis G3]|uniref:Right handed beta helix domain-containing protein n=1 Tax=Trichomonas vaginalis (strain ATCC PRA-98 / G3) TaxID=412133 RepID=A2ELS3_TRIV3|nr:hypothetical protein TVAGG3_0401210 [Trichomonas vaginalis G3]EAY06351.1 hypothetical protein TVAG_151580 [Trichomonas vaginalis G3]KAI5534710.1 hypothetical protein TVAGG3_0401210 [Trichomonas vaginalis G3]|eukprot:XP_001318574.1 hypothetical protein [Trichomonas vaginalis G3]
MSDIWNRFFNGYSYNNHTSNTQVPASSGNYHIHHVYFTNLNSRIVYFSGSNESKLLISFCVFDSNSGNNKGVNIYQVEGQCVQYRICSYSSTTNNNYPHSYINVTNNQEYKNYLIESTITLSKGNSGPIYQQFGDIKIHNVNISNSESFQHDSVYYLYASQLTASISYSTFFNNTAKYYRSLCHQYGNININYSNILSNQCRQVYYTDNGIIYASSNSIVTVEQCILSNNKGYYLFCTKNAGKQMIIKFCYFPSNEIIETAYGPVTTSTNNSLQINNEHFNTAMCYAPNPFKSITLQSVKLERTEYYYKIDRYINVSGNGKCDINSITIYCIIDGYDAYELNNRTLSYQENDMTYSFTGFCEIPNTVNEPGNHSLSVHASNGIDISKSVRSKF